LRDQLTRVRPRIIVLVGLPGSGKSTWARQQGAAVISTDDIRFLLSDDETNQTIHRKVFGTVRYLVRHRIELQRPITYIDATNLTRKDRRPYIKTGQLYDCMVEAIYFNVPIEICKERNRARHRIVPDDVIELMAQRLLPPTIEEGFDAVTIYAPTGVAQPSTPPPESVPSFPSPRPES
jgi:predicted kinase